MPPLFENPLKPNDASRVFELANEAARAGNLPQATELYQRVIDLDPSRPDALYKLGNVQKDQGYLVESLKSYDRAVQRQPSFPMAYCNRGVVLHRLGRLEEALQSLDLALAQAPTDSISHYNRALVLQDLARREDALESYDHAIALNPQFGDAQYNRALLLLTLGSFSLGWRAFEWRWQVADRLLIGGQQNLPQPLWLGDQAIAGRRLLLHCEGGLGDTIQFSRYAVLCMERHARVTVQVQKPLVTILRSLPVVSEVIATEAVPAEFDLHCPLMSLPLALESAGSPFPLSGGYLTADPARVAAWGAKLGPKRRPRVGLVWSGNPGNWIDARRSIPLHEWLPLLPPQFDYYCLQTQIRPGDALALAESPIKTFHDGELDFDGTAALCKHLDLVISVDTSLAHLAGALAHPVWILLPTPADWRWGLSGDETAWYASARLYRQEPSTGWRPVLRRVASDLAAHFAT